MYWGRNSVEWKSATTQAALTFSYPVPHEVDGIFNDEPGTGKDERIFPSTLEDVEKGPYDIPFNPSAQTAENVGFTVICEKWLKSRMLFAKHNLKANKAKGAKRMISKVAYICVALFSLNTLKLAMKKMNVFRTQFTSERTCYLRVK